MDGRGRRATSVGRWAPVLLYAIIVLGWLADAAAHPTAAEHLPLVLWTIPAPLLYLWRTRP
jgi:hypothetical protein